MNLGDAHAMGQKPITFVRQVSNPTFLEATRGYNTIFRFNLGNLSVRTCSSTEQSFLSK